MRVKVESVQPGLDHYGLIGGSLYVLDPATGQIEQHPQLVKDQSIVNHSVCAVPAAGPVVAAFLVLLARL
jgi:hypothetical protein